MSFPFVVVIYTYIYIAQLHCMKGLQGTPTGDCSTVATAPGTFAYFTTSFWRLEAFPGWFPFVVVIWSFVLIYLNCSFLAACISMHVTFTAYHCIWECTSFTSGSVTRQGAFYKVAFKYTSIPGPAPLLHRSSDSRFHVHRRHRAQSRICRFAAVGWRPEAVPGRFRL